MEQTGEVMVVSRETGSTHGEGAAKGALTMCQVTLILVQRQVSNNTEVWKACTSAAP